MSSGSNITDIRTLPEFKIVVPSGLISGFVNAFCLVYLLARLLMRWWMTKRSLSMAHRVPFYIASSEFLLFWINLVNVGYSALNGHSIQGDACKVVGGIVAFIVTSNVTLVELSFRRNSIQKLGSDNSHLTRIDILVVRKIIAYILIFLIEWTPTTIYLIAQMFQYENIWIYTGSVIFINLGGIGNAILYISYEGWTNKYDSKGGNITYNSSEVSGTSQESYPQIKVHHLSVVEKENFTSDSSILDSTNQEL
ncbi:11201_t:CDS:2 [Dentiscutata erythropus]|uniref:11201_t:CDS:1 n=1 Tax=Dentiscutata erythropus TaxID=1348616 RepID=A0A9N9AVY8_9GLOM|nr:11201_t:CDS:2 [Dentiscutata erythropus]